MVEHVKGWLAHLAGEESPSSPA